MRADCPERGEVDLEQHGSDHQPHQDGYRQIDVRNLRRVDHVKDAGYQTAEGNADDDAKRHPECQVTLAIRDPPQYVELRPSLRERCRPLDAEPNLGYRVFLGTEWEVAS